MPHEVRNMLFVGLFCGCFEHFFHRKLGFSDAKRPRIRSMSKESIRNPNWCPMRFKIDHNPHRNAFGSLRIDSVSKKFGNIYENDQTIRGNVRPHVSKYFSSKRFKTCLKDDRGMSNNIYVVSIIDKKTIHEGFNGSLLKNLNFFVKFFGIFPVKKWPKKARPVGSTQYPLFRKKTGSTGQYR